MAAPDPYAAIPGQRFTAANWREDLRNYSPNSAALFGPGGGESALVGNVDFARSIPALRYFLGYSNVDPTFPNPGVYKLQRTPPVYHPKYPRLVCVSAGCEDFKPYPQASSGGTKTAKIPQTTLPTPPAGTAAGYNKIYGTSLGYMTSYQKSKITARFAPVPYLMLDDDEAFNREWTRWCWIDQTPKTEILSLSGFKQIFYEGDNNAAPVSNPKGNSYQSDVGTVLIKSDLQVNWVSVPGTWLFKMADGNLPGNFPRNIVWGLGTVNSTEWNGYDAGTLLLSGAMLVRKPWSLAAGTEDRFNWDVTFLMTYFDPPKGYSVIGGVETRLDRVGDTRGHNCCPWQGSFLTGDKNAGLWFGASYNGSKTGQALFGTSDFAKLFNCPQNPY